MQLAEPRLPKQITFQRANFLNRLIMMRNHNHAIPVRRSILACLATIILTCVPLKASHADDFVSKASETLGATLVAHCVTSHVNLDLVANAFEAEELADDQALQLVKLNIQMLDQVGPLVIELTKTADCSEEDRKVLVAIAKSYKAIKAEAKALEAYIGSWEPSDWKAFKKAQAQAQTEMDTIGG